MPHRILHLIDTGGPGGAETVFHDVATGMAGRGWECTAAVPVEDWLSDTLRRSGIEPVIVPTGKSFDVRYANRLTRLARSATIIHAHLLGSSVYGALAAARARIPLVCTFHGAVDIESSDRLRHVKFRIIRQLGRAQVVFVSEALRRTFLEAVRIDPERTTVVPNGIDVGRFGVSGRTSLRAELGLRSDDVLVGAIGNVRPSKAYDVLLRACAILVRSGAASFVCVLAGQLTGTLYEQLVALHAELGLGDRVRFIGFRDDIPALMRSLDLYVSSSSAEGFSLTTIEAMASGVPVVATRSGGPEEIIEHGVDGVLVPAGSSDRLADAMRELIGDPVRRSALAAAARDKVARRYTVEAMLDSYEALYARALDERGRVMYRSGGVAATA